jgi:DNA-directed RNA polymerase subunit M/transcription elongation factor TFIIS
MTTRIIKNPTEFRENIRNKLNEFFNDEKHGINLEKGVHNWAIKESTTKKVIKKWDNPFFVQIYLNHLRSIYINLKQTRIINIVNSGEIKSQDIAFMTHQELCPDKWGPLIKAKSIRDKNKFEDNIEAMTDTFTCRKCKSKKCSYYLMQCRSADEPMNIFITCLNCGARMKK